MSKIKISADDVKKFFNENFFNENEAASNEMFIIFIPKNNDSYTLFPANVAPNDTIRKIFIKGIENLKGNGEFDFINYVKSRIGINIDDLNEELEEKREEEEKEIIDIEVIVYRNNDYQLQKDEAGNIIVVSLKTKKVISNKSPVYKKIVSMYQKSK